VCQYKLAFALNRLSFYYSGIGQRGGTDEMTVEAAQEKAIEVVDEAITIFQEVNLSAYSDRSKVLPESLGPMGDADLHFSSFQPDTSLYCKTKYGASASRGVSVFFPSLCPAG